jgi:ABC-type amino acid transport substrate-binding protein
MNALALALDSDYDGDFTDETWYTALTTPTWVVTPADGTIQGGIYKAGTAGASIAQFDLLYRDPSTLKYSPFIAATGTKVSGVDIPIAMATAAASADDSITVVTGVFYVYNTGWSGLGGIGNAQIYPSTATAGGITATLSTTSGDLVCVVGVGEAGSKIQFRLPATPSIEVP